MVEGFLGRWSQRKQAQRAGKALDEPVLKPVPASAAPVAQDLTVAQESPSPVAGPDALPATPVAPEAPAPLPSLEDVKSLTPQSDFSPFVARDVAPEVRNAAMKKLFSDPHYNVMDRLDTYIDDYSKPDPLPEAMLRQMASAKFLKLFEDEEESAQEDQVKAALREDANSPEMNSVPQSAPMPPPDAHQFTDSPTQAPGTADDHTDLQLQPNHAAGPPEPGRSTE